MTDAMISRIKVSAWTALLAIKAADKAAMLHGASDEDVTGQQERGRLRTTMHQER